MAKKIATHFQKFSAKELLGLQNDWDLAQLDKKDVEQTPAEIPESLKRGTHIS